MLYRYLLRPLIFNVTRNNPEYAHNATINLLHFLEILSLTPVISNISGFVQDTRLQRCIWNLTFPNPIGLAAGFDKDGTAIPALAKLGFGFLEIGTVTLQPQSGQPSPRVFRLPTSHAIINRMGFNNHGAVALATRLQSLGKLSLPIGISIGKNKDTPDAAAITDYCQSLELLYPYLDYVVINISSPNTPGLRNLQHRAALENLLRELNIVLRRLTTNNIHKPLLVKISPDLSPTQLLDILEVCTEQKIAGIVATNTTTERTCLAKKDQILGNQAGGLSGQPLTIKSRAMVAAIYKETNGRLPIIGVGGIMTVDDALQMLDAGASLIQVYTGLVYAGIGLIRKINLALLQRKI
jgi:dihydroorotate dehydrogenase